MENNYKPKRERDNYEPKPGEEIESIKDISEKKIDKNYGEKRVEELSLTNGLPFTNKQILERHIFMSKVDLSKI